MLEVSGCGEGKGSVGMQPLYAMAASWGEGEEEEALLYVCGDVGLLELHGLGPIWSRT